MTIEKLPSGSYRVKQMHKGKTYRITFDHKPTQKEMALALAERMQDDSPAVRDSFENYAQRYIESKRQILSPASVRTYNEQINALSADFKSKNLFDITQEDVQKEISRHAVDHAPKTTRSLHGFIASVFGMFRPHLVLKTTLPRLEKKKGYLPTSEDVKRILEAINGTEYSIPFQLGILGLRRGEICALEISDLDGENLTINKTMVYNKGWIIKNTPKTDESNRTITIPERLAKEIKEAGTIYEGDPKRLNKHLQRIQKQLDIPAFRFHDFRHYFASYASNIASEADVMAMGGWKSDHVFKTCYRESMEESRKKAMKKISDNIL